jgi:predicted hydrocarbon binding protein
MAVGIFGPLFGVELANEEIKCRNKGDDYCEFILKAKDGLPLVRKSAPF